ncbi:phosphofurin acidic cluster sorting protein KrT95D isoform X2 [Lycorma delicatula]|uniref:phosphofurin acidic cluster sorting protein KrT95D isoform X2 n=1 Tax=Lycorma delicatula TaxID=130591 RepID=UPI003F50EFA8
MFFSVRENMADKSNKPTPLVGIKPVPMKLFATWEVDRTPPNCIPRLCSLTLSRLVVFKALGSDLASITIAVKVQGSKRTLRSNEMALPPNGLLDTELQLNFSLQYPHFLKRDGNKLHVMLQRRKRYKNRTILGYKTLAEGVVNMSQVLQRQMDLELDLVSDIKTDVKSHGNSNVVARVTVQSLNSQPVDHEDSTKHSQHAGRVADFSDDDEEFSSNEEGEGEGEGEGSDSEPMLEERRARKAKIPVNARQRNLKQKFIALLKRFRVSEDLHGLASDRETIGRKLSGGDMDPADIEDLFEELEDLSDSGPEVDTMSISSTPKPSLRPFFSSSRSLLHADSLNVPTERGLERLSDESSKKADSDSHPENWTDSDPPPQPSSPPKNSDEKKLQQQQQLQEVGERERKGRLFNRDRNSQSGGKTKKQHPQSQQQQLYDRQTTPAPIHLHIHGDTNANEQPRKVLLEQLTRVLPSEDFVPDQLCLVNTGDPLGALLASRLQDRQHKVICTASSADVRATISCLVNKIQKFCNSNPKPPAQIKLLLAGSDSFVNCVLRHYVEQLSFKPPDWQTYIRFLVVPLGNNTLCRYLGSLDGIYNAAFASESWRDILERGDSSEAATRIQRYVQQSSGQATVHLPIAEAMLTYKEKRSSIESKYIIIKKVKKVRMTSTFIRRSIHRFISTSVRSDDESSQIFIPFMNDVRLGSPEGSASASVDLEEMNTATSPAAPLSGSPPSSLQTVGEKKVTPPSSPNMSATIIGPNSMFRELCEPLELQLDYWLIPGSDSGGGSQVKGKGDSTKSTLKSTFRSLQIARLSLSGEQPSPHFTINYSTKEKKQKIMRLGKKKEKEKENEPRSQVVEGVSRLICSPKTQNIPLKLCIDGTEWTGVKFFQLSAHWQTHVRYFPVSLFTAHDSTQL